MKTSSSIHQIKTVLLIAIVVSLTFFACRKTDKIIPAKTNQFENTAQVVASISGQVLDENGVPIAGATVAVGNNTFLTASNGVFFFQKISTKENATLISVTKPGYFKGFRTLSILKNQNHYTKIRVLKMDNPQNFTTSLDVNIIATGGASVKIAKNTIMNKATGVPYNGVVQIQAKTIRALDANIGELTPGALRGINTDGQENALATYGMLAVEMQDASGNALQIATGKTAEIHMPIEAAQLATAPATIPLWHFDEVASMWIEDGKATKIGNEYVGNVSHFSYWNCDFGGPICTFTATFLDIANNNPLSGFQVKIISNLATAGTRSAWTNSSGLVNGGIPANTSYTLNLIDQCGNTFYTTTFNSTTSAINLGNILVAMPSTNTATISGTAVDCSNVPLSNAVIIITNGSNSITDTTDALGNFSYTTLLCINPTAFTFTAFDPTTFVNGTVATNVIPGINAIGTIAACGTINEFVNYSITEASGTKTFSHIAPTDNFTTSNFSPLTQISSNGQNTLGNKSINFNFDGAGTIGAHNITAFSHYSYAAGATYFCSNDSSTAIAVPINITQYGAAVGDFIQGNFNGSFSNTSPVNSYTITGSFATKRDF